MVVLKKLRYSQLRIDKVRGFEILRVKPSDMDALIAALKELIRGSSLRMNRIKTALPGGISLPLC